MRATTFIFSKMANPNRRLRTPEEINDFLNDLQSDFEESFSEDDSNESEDGKNV